jgi:hypothetical protein
MPHSDQTHPIWNEGNLRRAIEAASPCGRGTSTRIGLRWTIWVPIYGIFLRGRK